MHNCILKKLKTYNLEKQVIHIQIGQFIKSQSKDTLHLSFYLNAAAGVQ